MKAIINKLEVDDRGTRGFTILHKGDKKSKALLKNTLFSLNIYTEVDFDTLCKFFLSEKIEELYDKDLFDSFNIKELEGLSLNQLVNFIIN